MKLRSQKLMRVSKSGKSTFSTQLEVIRVVYELRVMEWIICPWKSYLKNRWNLHVLEFILLSKICVIYVTWWIFDNKIDYRVCKLHRFFKCFFKDKISC